jgi:hypothetical protein
MQSAEKSSLYDRLGGVYSIATVVDDFIDRVMTDPRLNANPLVDEAHHRVLRDSSRHGELVVEPSEALLLSLARTLGLASFLPDPSWDVAAMDILNGVVAGATVRRGQLEQ